MFTYQELSSLKVVDLKKLLEYYCPEVKFRSNASKKKLLELALEHLVQPEYEDQEEEKVQKSVRIARIHKNNRSS